MTWLVADGDGVALRLHIQPGAKKTEVAGLHGEALKIRLAAPPVDGKANEELVALVAERLGCRKTAVTIRAGASGRMKLIKVDGVLRPVGSDSTTTFSSPLP